MVGKLQNKKSFSKLKSLNFHVFSVQNVVLQLFDPYHVTNIRHKMDLPSLAKSAAAIRIISFFLFSDLIFHISKWCVKLWAAQVFLLAKMVHFFGLDDCQKQFSFSKKIVQIFKSLEATFFPAKSYLQGVENQLFSYRKGLKMAFKIHAFFFTTLLQNSYCVFYGLFTTSCWP